jgi:hypothetical protein
MARIRKLDTRDRPVADRPETIALTRDERRRWLLARASGRLSIEQVTAFLRSARANMKDRLWPLLFDARACQTAMTQADVRTAVAIVQSVARRKQRRAHVALVADDDRLYRWFLSYETQCAEAGVSVIRVFRQLEDAERWLDIMSSARELG